MSFEEAITQQPLWVQYWLNWLLVGAFVLPLALLIWRQTRLVAIATVVASLLGGLGVSWMYGQLGYVKLLGLPHIILWTPIAVWMIHLLRGGDLQPTPRWILVVVLATILMSLAFDYTDVIRFALGNRAPAAQPPT